MGNLRLPFISAVMFGLLTQSAIAQTPQTSNFTQVLSTSEQAQTSNLVILSPVSNLTTTSFTSIPVGTSNLQLVPNTTIISPQLITSPVNSTTLPQTAISSPFVQQGTVSQTMGDFVRFSQAGQLLSVEVPVNAAIATESVMMMPQSMPQLLTGTSINQATQVNMTATGQLMLINPATNILNVNSVLPHNLDANNPILNLPSPIEMNLDKQAIANLNVLGTLVSQNYGGMNGFSDLIGEFEQRRVNEFTRYLGQNLSLNSSSPREILKRMEEQTGSRSAVVYVTLQSKQLDLVVFTARKSPKLERVNVSRDMLTAEAKEFLSKVTNPRYRSSTEYLKSSQKLYQWLIKPIESHLKSASIDTVLFSLDSGLRSLPIAALSDGEKFLVEKYNLSIIPSISLMDSRYRPIQNTKVLAMGASEFIDLQPLPSVPVELDVITQKLWQGNAFLNQDFTLDNLKRQRKDYPYQIIHLATHSEFKAGKPENSYIQLWKEEKLGLDQLRRLGWNDPSVELLVLSSCRTALGDEQAELGFAGLAIQAGVKSALASLWYVSDEGTLGLMAEFYNNLGTTKIKAEALRKAQLAMIHNQVQITEGKLQLQPEQNSVVELPPEIAQLGQKSFSHPYYWSGFTMIGSPW